MQELTKEEAIVRPDNVVGFFNVCLGVTPYPPQRGILRALYTLPLDDEDRELLYMWKEQGKTNWIEGETYNDLVLVAGMRGGKTVLGGGIGLYEADEIAQFDDPARHFGLIPGQQIFVINVATSEVQARDTVFAAMEGLVDNSDYYQQLIKEEKFEKRSRMEMAYPDKNIIFRSGHSSSASLVGKTSICTVFDELARFEDSKTGASSGKMVYESLGRSVATLGGRRIAISSPIYEDDPIMVLFRSAMEGKTRRVLAFKLATWELNPNLPKDGIFIMNEYAADPEAADRDYGANPPTTDNPFFQYPEKINDCIVYSDPPCLVEEGTTTRVIENTGELKEYVRLNISNLNFNPEHVYYAFGDAATETDSYTLAIGHGVSVLQEVQTDDGVETRAIQKPIIDLVLEWKPDKKKRKSVDVLNVTAILEELAGKVSFGKVMFDRFNAPHQIQRLVELGIDAESKQFSRDFQVMLYDTLKNLVYTGTVEICGHVNGRPSEKHINQLKHIRIQGGSKITHRELGKDLADVIAGLAWLISSGGSEEVGGVVMPFLTSVNFRW